MADAATPLCTWAQFTEGPFADLARAYPNPSAQADLLLEATRLVEDTCGRRLAPFAGVTETHRATGIDPDEYGSSAALVPMSVVGSLGRSYADALGAGDDLVRHCWLNEYAPRYSEMWTYSGVSVEVVRSAGGSQVFTSGDITGPEADSGHLWFTLGSFVPIGSLIRVTYGGGYSTMPASLVRAGKFMAASLIVREMQPSANSRDPDLLVKECERALVGFVRN